MCTERIPFSQLEEFIKECRAVGDYIDIGENTLINKAVMSLNLWKLSLTFGRKCREGNILYLRL